MSEPVSSEQPANRRGTSQRYPTGKVRHSQVFKDYDRALTKRAVRELAKGKTIIGPGIERALELEAEGKTQEEIGAALGVGQSHISRTLARFRDTRKLARFRLHAAADQMATHTISAAAVAAQKGDASIALEVLDRLDVAVAKRREGQGGAQILVVVGRADPAALPDFSQVASRTAQDALEPAIVSPSLSS